ncbi:type II secretion system F family protein [Halospeciosus flavus]|uniref:Type II secretion system F family protein n=1 Tax=Halospeciosus flavus TaxID=3032283 RepID=A0ABD5Z3Y7_9EURY|nr:type II secretion system F family protein [Halospeciosus flavus]
MNGLLFLPLVGVFFLLGVVALVPLSRRVDRLLTRLAIAVFGAYVRERESVNSRQANLLRSIHHGTTYRVYASKTFLYATVAAFSGSVLGVYLVVAFIVWMRTGQQALQTTLPTEVAVFLDATGPLLTPTEVFLFFLASGATVGVTAAFAAYHVRWSLPKHRANERERQIDRTIERNVAFMYALSRSGMAFPEILRILARNREVYGETATEFQVAIKDVDLFGADILEATRRLARRTPSEELKEFAENLVSVLQSGQDLPSFLRQEYEYYKEEAESKQAQYLELLATLAEAYVTVFVAGPLFFITILVVIGLVMGGTLDFLRAFVYLLLPLATVAFVVYLDSLVESGRLSGQAPERGEVGERSPGRPASLSPATTDGGVPNTAAEEADDRRVENRARLDLYRRIRPYRRLVLDPLEVVQQKPRRLLYVTIPLAFVYVAFTVWSTAQTGTLGVRDVDGPLVYAALFVVGMFSVAYELRNQRIKSIEAVVPDFLDRLASTNEAGMPIVGSLRRVVRSELGELTPELQRTWADISWGAKVSTALHRLDRRVGTPTVTRAVALITNAISASGDLGPVLRIAADEAKASRRLERERRSELFTYLVVIYLSFFVFLTIIGALVLVFVPSIPTMPSVGTETLPVTPELGFGGAGAAKKDAYTLLLFHAALIQAVCSGFVAGQMEQNDVRAGAKHVVVMLLLGYVTFLILGP